MRYYIPNFSGQLVKSACVQCICSLPVNDGKGNKVAFDEA